jgi:hypothetical protein
MASAVAMNSSRKEEKEEKFSLMARERSVEGCDTTLGSVAWGERRS